MVVFSFEQLASGKGINLYLLNAFLFPGLDSKF